MSACIIKPHHAGLFSLINNVITCMAMYDHVYVDWSKGCLYGDCWDALFENQPSTLDEVTADPAVEIITNYPHQLLTYKSAGKLYLSGDAWRDEPHQQWNRLIVRKEIREAVDTLVWRYNIDRIPAVLVRADTHAGEQLSDISQPLEDYSRALRKIGASRVHVMAGDQETLQWFSSRFDASWLRTTRRSETRAQDFHLNNPQTVEDARNCMIEVLASSRARCLVHPVSNMATAALYMNPQLKSIFLL